MGEATDELNPRAAGPDHAREGNTAEFPTGTGRRLGDENWLPHEGEPKIMSAPNPPDDRFQHDRTSGQQHASDDDEQDSHEIIEIEQEIEHTRAELSDTIDSIQARLAPDHLVEQAKEAARDAGSNLVEETKAALLDATLGKADQFLGKAEQIVSEVNYTARDAGESLLDTIRHNPVPAAMAGIGLGMLFTKRRASHNRDIHSTNRWRYDDEYPAAVRRPYTHQNDIGMSGGMSTGTTQTFRRTDESTSGPGDSIKETVGGIASNASELASDAGDRAAHLATSAGSTAYSAGESFWDMIRRNPMPAAVTGLGLAWMFMNREETRFRPLDTVNEKMPPMPPVGEIAGTAKDRIGDLGSGARMKVQGAQGTLGHMLQETPLAMGAAAIGLGAALGLAVPTTPRERELMGSARETFMEKTQQAAQEAQQRLMHVAEEVKDTVVQETSGSAQQAQQDTQQRLQRVEDHQDMARDDLHQAQRDLQNPQTKAS